MKLIGHSQGRPDPSQRVPINVHPASRSNLARLLFMPEMQGVGYSEFLNRAIAQAYSEITQEREEVKQREAYD